MKAKLISENVESKAQTISNVHAQRVKNLLSSLPWFCFSCRKNCLQDPVCLKFSTIQWSTISNLHLHFYKFGMNLLELVTQTSHEIFSN